MKKIDQAFDNALHLLTAPVTVVGASSAGVLGGLTAAWVTRVSLLPPLLVVAIGRKRHTWGVLAAADELSISVLHEDQLEVARLFGMNSGRDIDKWALTPHDLIGDGVPVVADCSARYLCRLTDRFATGDHDCLVCEILTAETIRGAPVLPLRGADYAPGKS